MADDKNRDPEYKPNQPLRRFLQFLARGALNALLAEVERTGAAVTITNHGRPVAVLTPVHQRDRKFG